MQALELHILSLEDIKPQESRLLSYVDESRREKALSYAFEKDRLLSLGAAYFLRKYVNGPIEENPYGKLLSDSSFFSLSHSGDKVVFLIAPFPCGVDIETREKPLPSLKRWAFSPKEASSLIKDESVLSAWTRKEALAKAEGSGFALTPIKEIPSKEGEVLYLGKAYRVFTLPFEEINARVSLAYEKRGDAEPPLEIIRESLSL